jgi:hypothetical protein
VRNAGTGMAWKSDLMGCGRDSSSTAKSSKPTKHLRPQLHPDLSLKLSVAFSQSSDTVQYICLGDYAPHAKRLLTLPHASTLVPRSNANLSNLTQAELNPHLAPFLAVLYPPS